ncbi:hypothetical protein niasHS_003982 [Heterodera schachtii]|uniref:Domain of unknown function DB domain-containing protein n=1 Tax=Heterodera schachtii TaxID=97005 RepID=A0ABD2K3Z9_HETSC
MEMGEKANGKMKTRKSDTKSDPSPNAQKRLHLTLKIQICPNSAATVPPLPLATVSAAVTVSPLMTPNAKLELCCQKQQLPSTCQQFCNFDTFTQEKLLIALLGSHCPSAQLSKAFDCATSKVDHSECCRQEGIDRIHNGQCMVFCRTHIKTPPNVAGYVSCLSVFGTIKNCYRDHQIKHKNLFGD